MPVCPNGHDSDSADYCDECGLKLNAPTSAAAEKAVVENAMVEKAVVEPGGRLCPDCGLPRSGRYCEVCGYDFTADAPVSERTAPPAPASAPAVSAPPASAPPASAPPAAAPLAAAPPDLAPAASAPAVQEHATAWTAVTTADRAYYESVRALDGPDATAITFPPYCPERRFTLTGDHVRIGRRSASRGIDPEIDLTGPPTDPGVSHLHAILLAQPDGTWAIVDPGSSNGTTLNGASEPIQTNQVTPLHDGDRIHVGAWTTIHLSAPHPE